MIRFQHTAARRRLWETVKSALIAGWVSTHSRPKGAGRLSAQAHCSTVVSTHSRPKAAEYFCIPCRPIRIVSTHSRPKAAVFGRKTERRPKGGFNTQPPEGGWSSEIRRPFLMEFQHTAARRRLFNLLTLQPIQHRFQHTAARRRLVNGRRFGH